MFLCPWTLLHILFYSKNQFYPFFRFKFSISSLCYKERLVSHHPSGSKEFCLVDFSRRSIITDRVPAIFDPVTDSALQLESFKMLLSFCSGIVTTVHNVKGCRKSEAWFCLPPLNVLPSSSCIKGAGSQRPYFACLP